MEEKLKDKVILIVGAGFGQLPAIEAANQMGLTTVVVDKNPNAIGASKATFFYDVDIVDKKAVLKIARKHKISGAMTMQSDLPVPTIGYINNALGLRGVSHEAANVCSNKMETRKRLRGKSAAQPEFEIVSSLEEAYKAVRKIEFPCVIKSPDSSGSRGVTKVSSTAEIEGAFNEAFKYTREVSILVEEYIDGLEFGAQTFSVNGACECVLMHGDTISDPPYMIPIGHSFPFLLLKDEELELAKEDIKNAVNVLGIINGPANVDLILDRKTNRIKIIEVGARIGATCLPELVYYHTGIDWVKNTILNAIGMDVDLQLKRKSPVAALIIESPKDGVFSGYKIPTNIDKDHLIEFEVTAKKGDEVSQLRKGTDRIGKVIVNGSDVNEAEKNALNFRDCVEVIVE